jgi:ribonuclease HI
MAIIAATDGSCIGNPGPGGWAWVTEDGQEATGLAVRTTNNRMELQAVLELLKATDPRQPLVIQTDSAYVIGVFTEWLEGWRQRGMRTSSGKPVENVDLIEDIVEKIEGRRVDYEKVLGHSGHSLNERADTLAQAAARKAAHTPSEDLSNQPGTPSEAPTLPKGNVHGSERIAELGSLFAGLNEVARNYQYSNDFQPAPNSIATREVNKEQPVLAGDWSAKPVYDAYAMAASALFGAEDHLDALTRILKDPTPRVATATLVRGVLEASGRAWWLLDPGIGARLRVARSMTERLFNLGERMKIEADIGKQTIEAERRIEKIVSSARHKGFRVLPGKPEAIEERRPGNTELSAMLLSGSEEKFGRVAYRYLSAVAHANQSGIMAGLNRERDPQSVHDFIGVPDISPSAIEPLVAMAAIAFVASFDRQVKLFGWEARTWVSRRNRALKTLRPAPADEL